MTIVSCTARQLIVGGELHSLKDGVDILLSIHGEKSLPHYIQVQIWITQPCVQFNNVIQQEYKDNNINYQLKACIADKARDCGYLLIDLLSVVCLLSKTKVKLYQGAYIRRRALWLHNSVSAVVSVSAVPAAVSKKSGPTPQLQSSLSCQHPSPAPTLQHTTQRAHWEKCLHNSGFWC